MNVAVTIKYSNKLPLATITATGINNEDAIESCVESVRGGLYAVCSLPPVLRTKSGIIKVMSLILYNKLAPAIPVEAKMHFSQQQIDAFVVRFKKKLQEVIEKHPEQKTESKVIMLNNPAPADEVKKITLD